MLTRMKWAKKTTQRKEDKMIKCEADNYGNVVFTGRKNGIDTPYILTHHEAIELSIKLDKVLDDCADAEWEFASKHKD